MTHLAIGPAHAYLSGVQPFMPSVTATPVASHATRMSLNATLITTAAGQPSSAASHPSFSETLAHLQQSEPADQKNAIQNEPVIDSPSRQLSQLGLPVGSSTTSAQATGDETSSSNPESQSGAPQPQTKASTDASIPAARAEVGSEPKKQSVEDVYVSLASLRQTSSPEIGSGTAAANEPATVHQAAVLRPTSSPADKPKQSKAATATSKLSASTVEIATESFALSNPAISNNAPPANPDNATAAASSGLSALAECDSSSHNTSVGPRAEVAFAVKIQGGSAAASKIQKIADSSAADADDQASPGASSVALKPVLPGTGQKDGTEQKDGSLDLADKVPVKKEGPENLGTLVTVPAAAHAQASADGTAKTASSSAGQAAASPSDPLEDGRASVSNLKTVQVQLTADNNQRVDLRLMEKSGALSISVRTADGALTKALQQQLPELSSKLSEQQVRAEWWTPSLQKTESAQSTKDSSGGGSGQQANQDSGNQGKGNSGQQSGRGTRQPDWVEELADLRKSNQNGAQYTWHL